MRNKIVAVIVALGGFACLAAVPVSTSQAATSPTKSAPTQTCPPGTSVLSYCAETCPDGTSLVANYCESCPSGTSLASDYCEVCPNGTTLVAGYCETSSGKVLPQGPPTVFDPVLWGSEQKAWYRGPCLKFHVRAGINGAPGIVSIKLTLPSGMAFATSGSRVTVTASKLPKPTATTATLTLDRAVGSLLVYVKNHSIIESQTLRKELADGTVAKLTFKVAVTDEKGLVTNLSFSVAPQT